MSAPRDWLQAHAGHQGDECLPWPFGIIDGYAVFAEAKQTRYAHRVMCEIVKGPAPSPQHLAARSCGRNGVPCVHPGHLSWKSRSQIRKEEAAAQRAGPRKKRRWKLTREQTIKVRELKGKKSQRAIGAMFGIRQQTVAYLQQQTFYRSPERERIHAALEATAAPMSIREVMKAAGVSYWCATNVLRKLTLEATVVRFRRGRYRAPLTAQLMRKVTTAVRSAVPTAMPRHIRDEVIQEVLLAFMEGTASLARLGADVERARRKYWRAYPGKFGPRSLDAPMRDGCTLHDTLAAPQ